MILQSLGEVELHHLRTPEQVARWRPGFIGAYQTIFAGPPYQERHYPADVDGLYRKLTATPDQISLVAVHGSRLVGFGIAVPLRFKKSVARSLAGLVPATHTMYLAELGVLSPYRGQGLGRALIRHRLQLMDAERYSHVVLRVPASSTTRRGLYESMGYEDMGVYQEVAARRIDGSVTTDRRLFLHGVLSQLDLGDDFLRQPTLDG